MMVLFVSQCEKHALKRTRRVLDSFADRIGDNTWRTVITKEGLNAVYKLLRKTASKSTAVSCHWIRSRSRSELLWVVGKREKFNEEGIVPVHRTQKNILSNYKESDWDYLPLIKSLVAIAALFHDWGKSNDFFQEKLAPKNKKRVMGDPLRHEWVSCMLLHAFIKVCQSNATDWLDALSNGNIDEEKIISMVVEGVDKPLSQIPELAQVVFWLILSHHKLPTYSTKKEILAKEWANEEVTALEDIFYFITKEWGYENKKEDDSQQKQIKKTVSFSKGLLLDTTHWMKAVKKWAVKLQVQQELFEKAVENGSIRIVLHHARLALMLGDHHYSSLQSDKTFKSETTLAANTDPKTGLVKQSLDEHLLGVTKTALRITHLLPRLESEMPSVPYVKTLLKPSPKAFAWQDKAVHVIKENDAQRNGWFIVNLASTGSGKTLANAKVMQALSPDHKSLRYTLALGLRTLTLQTGDEYRKRIGLDNSQLGVLIGSKAVTMLHGSSVEDENSTAAFSGSESVESLGNDYIDFDDLNDIKLLDTVLRSTKHQQLLHVPVLACTIDHLMGAVETKKGGRYILPSLRVQNSDLVIDEIDDFSGSDLIAIGRLVYMAAMLGKKVMISSATIPPDLAEGYFNIYRSGWKLYAKTRDVNTSVNCTWIDEFHTKVTKIETGNKAEAIEIYKNRHTAFVTRRIEHLKKQPVKRKADIIDLYETMEQCEFDDSETKETHYFSSIVSAIAQKHHDHHTIDMATLTKVSFGVVRMANIEPVIALYKYLLNVALDDDTQIRVMPYHSRQVLLLRHVQEQHLDKILKRKEKAAEELDAFQEILIRKHIDDANVKNLIFIVVATPVEEVGRDHDFDWSVIEPSSFRSIIQMAGRVRRHRTDEIKEPNIGLMQYNFKAFKACDESGKYFLRPGYEVNEQFATHDLKSLVDEQNLLERIDATPRILRPEVLDYKHSLSDMEHYTIHKDLTHYEQIGANTMQGFLNEQWHLTAHPQIFHPFRASQESVALYLYYDEEQGRLTFAEKDDRGMFVKDREDIYNIEIINPTVHRRTWLERDYNTLLTLYADKHSETEEEISKVFGEINFIYREGANYIYSDEYGLRLGDGSDV